MLLLAIVVLFSVEGCEGRGSEKVGGACVRDEACTTGVCIVERTNSAGTAWVGGYCSGNCRSRDCQGGQCVSLDDGFAYCLSSCAKASDCRQGYICALTKGVCVPDCRLGWDCGAELVCNRTTGECALPSVEATQGIGGACALNAECLSGLCIPEQAVPGGTAWAQGMCSQDCSVVECAAGSVCVKLDDGSAYCAPSCSDPSGCRASYVCSSAVAACLPDCRLGWSCGTQLVCDSSSGECVAPIVDAGAPPDDATTDTVEDSDSGWRGGRDAGRGPGPVWTTLP